MLLNLNQKILSSDGVTEHPVRIVRRQVKGADGNPVEAMVGIPSSFVGLIYPKLNMVKATQAKEETEPLFKLLLRLGAIKENTGNLEFSENEVLLMYKYGIYSEDVVVVGRWNEMITLAREVESAEQ